MGQSQNPNLSAPRGALHITGPYSTPNHNVGLVTGFCVPVHGADGLQGCVSFGGSEIDLEPETRLNLHLISMYAHGSLRFKRRSIRLGKATSWSMAMHRTMTS
ncbi:MULTISPECIES: autoinducer binding domain-containing protein [Mesorhizobium]|uniref:autoinducer binding domain-containing protein n=1 Tax=Rhizobium loti TaxID=381 RepID=UPI000D6C8701|nr:hypothetical protein EB232_34980 [Mesorhizobium sp. NZP2077]QKD20671.1 hypothetical protein HGP13_36935 [Mesorhizobium sp. NZP2077]